MNPSHLVRIGCVVVLTTGCGEGLTGLATDQGPLVNPYPQDVEQEWRRWPGPPRSIGSVPGTGSRVSARGTDGPRSEREGRREPGAAVP